jgi:hypothetical protein
MKKLRANIHILSFILSFYSLNTFATHDTLPEAKSKGRVWGYSFGDFFYKASGDTMHWGKYEYAPTNKGTIGGSLRRLYFGYDYEISKTFSSRLLLEASDFITTRQGQFGMAIKLGYCEWKNPLNLIPHSVLRGGLVPTPVMPFPEKVWGYRSIEKQALDPLWFSNYVDQGFSYEIEFNEKKNGGLTVMVGNGTSNYPGVNKKLEYYGAFYKKFLNDRLTFELMGNYKNTHDSIDKFIGMFFASYETEHLRLGMEVSEAVNEVWENGHYKKASPLIMSFYSAFELPLKDHVLHAFLRYDSFNPNARKRTSNSHIEEENYREHTFIGGVHFLLDQKVNIMPNLTVNTYQTKNNISEDRKPDILPRITLLWVFGD